MWKSTPRSCAGACNVFNPDSQTLRQTSANCLQQGRPAPLSLRLASSNRHRCRAGGPDAEEPRDVPKSKQEMLARIQKAKQYRQQGSTSPNFRAAAGHLPTVELAQRSYSTAEYWQPPCCPDHCPACFTSTESNTAVSAKKAKDVSETGYSSFGEVPEESADFEEGRRFTDAGTAAFAKARSSGFSRSADGSSRTAAQGGAAGPSGDAFDPPLALLSELQTF